MKAPAGGELIAGRRVPDSTVLTDRPPTGRRAASKIYFGCYPVRAPLA